MPPKKGSEGSKLATIPMGDVDPDETTVTDPNNPVGGNDSNSDISDEFASLAGDEPGLGENFQEDADDIDSEEVPEPKLEQTQAEEISDEADEEEVVPEPKKPSKKKSEEVSEELDEDLKIVATEETPADILSRLDAEDAIAAKATETPKAEEQQPEESQVVTKDQQEARIKEIRENARKEVRSKYTLTEEQIEQLREDPNEVLPELMTQMFFDVYESLMQGVQSQVPTMIGNVLDMQQRTTKGEQMFYGVWPQLNQPQFKDVVNRIADNYIALNPNATMSQRIKEIGAQAWVALRLPLDELQVHTASFAKQEVPETPTPSTQRKPAGPGAVPNSRRRSAQPKSEWDEFVDEVVHDDDIF